MSFIVLMVIAFTLWAVLALADKGRKARQSAATWKPSAPACPVVPANQANKLASAVENARKAAREEFARREREKDEAVDLKSAEKHLTELRAYMKKADAENIVAHFVEKTRHWPSWLTHKQGPLDYLSEEGFTISDTFHERLTEPKTDPPETWGFKLAHRGSAHSYRVTERRGYSVLNDDVSKRGLFEVLTEAGELVFKIPITYHTHEYGGDYRASVQSLELCKSVDWLVDAAVLLETVNAHTAASFKERNRENAVRRAGQAMNVPR